MLLKIILAYIGTNADDMLTNTVFFSNCDLKYTKNIFIGKIFGVGLIMFVCLLGAYGVNLIPFKNLNLLGCIPIILGLKYSISYKMQKISNKNKYTVSEIFLFTVSNCSNNIAIIIPTFHNYSIAFLIIVFFAFIFFTVIACYIAKIISQNSVIKRILEKAGMKFVSIVLITLGIMILLNL